MKIRKERRRKKRKNKMKKRLKRRIGIARSFGFPLLPVPSVFTSTRPLEDFIILIVIVFNSMLSKCYE